MQRNGVEVMKLRRTAAPVSALLGAASDRDVAALALTGCGAGGAPPIGATTASRSSSRAAARRTPADRRPVRRGDRHRDQSSSSSRTTVCTTASRPNSVGRGVVRHRRARRDLAERVRRRGRAARRSVHRRGEVRPVPGSRTESQVDGNFVGMPVFTNSEILFYRTDLFGTRRTRPTSRRSTATRSRRPRRGRSTRDVAEFFTRDTDGDGADRPVRHRREGCGRDRVARDRVAGGRGADGARPRDR